MIMPQTGIIMQLLHSYRSLTIYSLLVKATGLYDLPTSAFFIFFNQQTKPGIQSTSELRLVLDWTWKIHSDILLTSPLNFMGG